uniref:RING-type E3 ubiquitin transferase n=1 Tax=Panagrolaimus davidi TaxID=227884 RepID=A0A914Q0E7_9BILA
MILMNTWDSQTHFYNAFNNPQHLNLKEFMEYVDDFSNAGPINVQKFQYIQVEFGKGNIQTPESSYETIRQYLNSETRRPNEHIATFKRVKKPWIYVKLPTRHVKGVHTKFTFNFSKFSIETLKCTLNALLTKPTTKFDKKIARKPDLIKFIETEYSKNSTSFNIFFCIMQYCIIHIKQYFVIIPLSISIDVKDQLLQLNLDGPPYKQLLKLDELINECQNQYKNQFYIITGGNGYEFVVFLPVKRDIIKYYETLYYYDYEKNREIQIKWPTKSKKEKTEYSNWLKNNLIEKSEEYRNHVDRVQLQEFTDQEEKFFEEQHQILAFVQKFPSFIGIYEKFIDQYPVDTRLIAKFRLQQTKNHTFVNETFQSENEEGCPLCLEEYRLDEKYAIWPCGSHPPHFFHYDCILDSLRMNNACPLCRGKANISS